MEPRPAKVAHRLSVAIVDESTGEVVTSQSMRLTPLAYLESVYCDKEMPPQLRIEAARAAAPYVHKKMPVQLEAKIDITADDLVRRLKEGQRRARIIEHVPDEVTHEGVAS